MKIGIFSESYEPVLNGVSVSISTLICELKRLGHEIWVFAPRFKGHNDKEHRIIRFPSFCTWVAPDYPLAIPYLPRLVEKVQSLELDVIHTHTPFTLGWLGLRLAKRLNIPLVSTNHTLYTEYAHYFPLAPRSVTRLLIIGILRRYYKQCDAIIVPSNPIKELLKGYGIDKPVHVIPTGNTLRVEKDPQVRSQIRQECNIPTHARVLLYVGRLAREKNLELLFKAFDILGDKYSDVYLLVVGGGPYESSCRALADKLVHGNRVRFTGCIPREKVVGYYSAGDIFTFPSTTETQGLVIVEALSAGLPCVVVDAGGAPEMLVNGEDGFLAKNEIGDFASKIDRLLSNPDLLESFSKQAVINANRFSPTEMAHRVIEVYESVCQNKREPIFKI
jgi:glycosyltransferase involved in cell wall biosynthesis